MIEQLNTDAMLPQRPMPDASRIEHLSPLKQQYIRVREFCGFTLDELINDRAAQRTLREVWLVSCMVRRPQKARQLPEQNPFRDSRVIYMR